MLASPMVPFRSDRVVIPDIPKTHRLIPYLAEINRLDNQALVRSYDSEWHRWE